MTNKIIQIKLLESKGHIDVTVNGWIRDNYERFEIIDVDIFPSNDYPIIKDKAIVKYYIRVTE